MRIGAEENCEDYTEARQKRPAGTRKKGVCEIMRFFNVCDDVGGGVVMWRLLCRAIRCGQRV
jgi:hypothetical protein